FFFKRWEDFQSIFAHDLSPDAQGMIFAEFSALDFFRESFSQAAPGKFGGGIYAFGVMGVGAPHDTIRTHDFEPLLVGALAHGVADRREPYGIDPDVFVTGSDRARFANPGITTVEKNEFSLGVCGDEIHEQHRVTSLDTRMTG